MASEELKVKIGSRPALRRDGELAFPVKDTDYLANAESVLGMRFVCNRRLFGAVFARLLPRYFDAMPNASGVLVTGELPTEEIFPWITKPGDIDLLVVPYENDELILSRVLAIELKVIRATYARAGKSPGKFGLSQASGLIRGGLPYVAVGHLIVSDESPRSAYRRAIAFRLTNSDSGECEELGEFMKDHLPSDLVRRAHGRLKKNKAQREVGCFAAYIGGTGEIWAPAVSEAKANRLATTETMRTVADYYHANVGRFMDTPR